MAKALNSENVARCPKCKTSRVTFSAIGRDDEGKAIGEFWHCSDCAAFFAFGVRLEPPQQAADPTDDDRRQHRRFNVGFVIEMDMDGEHTQGPVLATTLNASEGGVCFLYPRSLDVGSEGKFRISLPSVAESFDARGRIVRCLRASDDYYGVGVSFTDVDERYRPALERYVRFLPS